MFCLVLISAAVPSPLKGYRFSWLLMGWYNSLSIFYSVCRKDLSCIQLSPGAQVWYYIDVISSKESYLSHTHAGRKSNHKGVYKNRGGNRLQLCIYNKVPPLQLDFWKLFGLLKTVPSLTLLEKKNSNNKIKLLIFSALRMLKQSWLLLRFWGFWRQYIPILKFFLA